MAVCRLGLLGTGGSLWCAAAPPPAVVVAMAAALRSVSLKS